jgi:protocatechuate 3,4-dioxygenase beta subunit
MRARKISGNTTLLRILSQITAVLICELSLAMASERGLVAKFDHLGQGSRTGVIAGRVIDVTSGRPVGGAMVALAVGAPMPTNSSGNQPPPPSPTRRGVVVADADGRFVFRDVPPGEYSVVATREGYAAGASGRMRPSGPGHAFALGESARPINLVVAMWRLGSISGTVIDDRGDPAVGLGVWALRRTNLGGGLEFTFTGAPRELTDDRGHYRFSNLLPGAYIVAVHGVLQSVALSTVAAYRSALEARVSDEFSRVWNETGARQISTAGLVIDNWQLSVSAGAPQPMLAPPGAVFVYPTMFYSNAKSAADATILPVQGGDDRAGVDFNLSVTRGVRVSGVLDGPRGPAANHGVSLLRRGAEELTEFPTAQAVTDQAGRFVLLGVPPGSYAVRARRVPTASGAAATELAATPTFFAEAQVTVGTQALDGVSLTLAHGTRLSGRVIFEGATRPPSRSQLSRLAIGARPIAGAATVSDLPVGPDGRFTTLGYPPGHYVMSVISSMDEWTPAAVRINGVEVGAGPFTIGGLDIDEVVVVLTEKVTTLSGTVHGPSGVAESTVILFPADVQAWTAAGMPPHRVATTTTTATGAYQIRPPFPGDYFVVAVPSDLVLDVHRASLARLISSAVRVSLLAGERKTQDLTVNRAEQVAAIQDR